MDKAGGNMCSLSRRSLLRPLWATTKKIQVHERITLRLPPCCEALFPSPICTTIRGLSSPRTVDLAAGLVISGRRMVMNLPLPGVAGLTSVDTSVDATVHDLVGRLKALDGTLSEAEVSNSAGQKVAASTVLGDMVGQDLFLTLGGDTCVRVMDQSLSAVIGCEGQAGHRTMPSPESFARLKEEVAKGGRRVLTHADFTAFCNEVGSRSGPSYPNGLEPMVVEGWLDGLVGEGLAISMDKGRTVLLNATGPGVSVEIADKLMQDDIFLGLKVERLREKLASVEEEERRLTSIRASLQNNAQMNVTAKKGAVLLFMTAQFTGLAFCVYEVYSWDVMEPATYFLMLSYSIGSAIYFSMKKRDASFQNFMDVAITKQEEKLAPALGYSDRKHKQLKAAVDRYRQVIGVLESCLKRDG